jgi:hypothetical protein
MGDLTTCEPRGQHLPLSSRSSLLEDFQRGHFLDERLYSSHISILKASIGVPRLHGESLRMDKRAAAQHGRQSARSCDIALTIQERRETRVELPVDTTEAGEDVAVVYLTSCQRCVHFNTCRPGKLSVMLKDEDSHWYNRISKRHSTTPWFSCWIGSKMLVHAWGGEQWLDVMCCLPMVPWLNQLVVSFVRAMTKPLAQCTNGSASPSTSHSGCSFMHHQGRLETPPLGSAKPNRAGRKDPRYNLQRYGIGDLLVVTDPNASPALMT